MSKYQNDLGDLAEAIARKQEQARRREIEKQRDLERKKEREQKEIERRCIDE